MFIYLNNYVCICVLSDKEKKYILSHLCADLCVFRVRVLSYLIVFMTGFQCKGVIKVEAGSYVLCRLSIRVDDHNTVIA